MVNHISDRVAVMYLGRLVEVLPAGKLAEQAVHPYTRALLSAVPASDPRATFADRVMLKGEPPNPVAPPTGCRSHPRCPRAVDRCRLEAPRLLPCSDGHQVACHL